MIIRIAKVRFSPLYLVLRTITKSLPYREIDGKGRRSNGSAKIRREDRHGRFKRSVDRAHRGAYSSERAFGGARRIIGRAYIGRKPEKFLRGR